MAHSTDTAREMTLDYLRPVFEFYEYVLQFARSCITVMDFSPQIIADEEDSVCSKSELSKS